jgi:hypothetical protein
VKGELLRRRLSQALDTEASDAAQEALQTPGVTGALQRSLERVHPAFLGGNYLPDTSKGEVEIARIVIDSTTWDVTCVYAKQEEGRIRYRVVDEYNGDTLAGETTMLSDAPLTLRELTDFFFGAWSLFDAVEWNCEGDLDGQLDFFCASSEFYPEFGRHCHELVLGRFLAKELRDASTRDHDTECN